jgi:beta-glucosidase
MLAGLGFNTYRFSVEWARIEPSEGRFDEAQLEHYRGMVAAVLESNLIPMVTLNHFTLPMWLAKQGGWLSEATPALFERYCRRVVEALGEGVDWYCTINEPGVVAYGGYMGADGFPPGTHGLANWTRASDMLIAGHRRARAAVKELRPSAMVGQTHSMHEWESDPGARAALEHARRMREDVFLEASKEDDFIGVQTYSRTRLESESDQTSGLPTDDAGDGIRRTQIGWEWRPQAVAVTVRRAAELLPGRPIVVTEHGVAASDDAERVEFITDGLKALHPLVGEGIPLRGYIHWSAFDNFEWAYGYAMQFGLIAVDRSTQQRTVKPSARFLGEIARTNTLTLPDS